MKNLVPGEGGEKPSWTERFMNMSAGLWSGGVASGQKSSDQKGSGQKGSDQKGSGPKVDLGQIIPPEKRKAAMRTLDATEHKWSLGALVLATVVGIAVPAYTLATHRFTKAGNHSIAVGPDALLLGGVILLFCIIGFLSLWKRKRTLLAFDLFLIGFGLSLVNYLGLAFIFLGGWLMLRAWRINRYGTTNAKLIASQTREQPRGRDRKQVTQTSKTSPTSGQRKPPAASKRYTPKAPPRKKIPKPESKPTQ